MGPHGERRSDAKLAAAAGAGEGAAFAALFERYGERIHAFCARLLGSQADAADATQETFLNLLVRLRAGGEPVRDVRAYLFTSARHASLRVLERGRRVDVTDAVPEPV